MCWEMYRRAVTTYLRRGPYKAKWQQQRTLNPANWISVCVCVMQLFYRKVAIFWFCICTHHYCTCKSCLVLRLGIVNWHPCLISFFAVLCLHDVVNATEKGIIEEAEPPVLQQPYACKYQYNTVSKHWKRIPQSSLYHSSKSEDFFCSHACLSPSLAPSQERQRGQAGAAGQRDNADDPANDAILHLLKRAVGKLRNWRL